MKPLRIECDPQFLSQLGFQGLLFVDYLLIITKWVATLDHVSAKLVITSEGEAVLLDQMAVRELAVADCDLLVRFNVPQGPQQEVAVIIVYFVDMRSDPSIGRRGVID